MSWLCIDDGFPEHEKVEGLSDAALALWVRCGCWCKKRRNAHLRGFIPQAIVVKVAGSAKRAQKLADELVQAKGDAAFGHEHGLWEPREGGWQFHNWDRYPGNAQHPTEPPTDQAGPPRSASSAAEFGRLGGLRSAEARRRAFGSAQPNPPSGYTPNPPSNPLRSQASEANPEPPSKLDLLRPQSNSLKSSNLKTCQVPRLRRVLRRAGYSKFTFKTTENASLVSVQSGPRCSSRPSSQRAKLRTRRTTSSVTLASSG